MPPGVSFLCLANVKLGVRSRRGDQSYDNLALERVAFTIFPVTEPMVSI